MKNWLILVLIMLIVGLVVYSGMKGRPQGVPVQKNDDVVAGLVPASIVKDKIAIMADVHDDVESLNKAIVRAKADGVKIIIVAGDLTINGTKLEQERVRNSLVAGKIEYYVVPGNHDDYKNVWIFGDKYQSIKQSGIKLIMIDNSNWRGLGTEQKKWIEAEAKECVVIKCVAVMHMPLSNNFSKHIMGENSVAVTAEAGWLKKILLGNNVTMAYSGHLHYSSDYAIDMWETVLVGAISKDRNTQAPRYTEVEIGVGNLVNRVIEYDIGN